MNLQNITGLEGVVVIVVILVVLVIASAVIGSVTRSVQCLLRALVTSFGLILLAAIVFWAMQML